MVFSSVVFLFYFLPLLLLVYFISPVRLKNIVLLLFSIFFYAWGMPRFIFVILGTTLIDFVLVRQMYEAELKWKKNLLLIISLSINLGLLFYFKYSNFFVENVNVLLQQLHLGKIKWVELVLPIGISFYTFETITYVVDVYRGVHAPLKKFWNYQLYIIFFPKLIAGPIVRYHEIADQIEGRFARDNIDNKLTGIYRFVIGLAKKVLIANIVGEQADAIFALDYNTIDTATAWVGALAYTMQIYFDFSGYSDMAIGLARIFGFTLPENFNHPYTSQSITEFWKRWHITLGRWMRDYLYIPLGGNRVSAQRLYFNLWFVFLVSGLWHGAAWGFILWGAYHGFFLVIERAFLLKVLKKAGKLISVIYAFLVVLVGWVFFRIEHLGGGLRYLRRMFSFSGGTDAYGDTRFWVVFAIAVFFSFFAIGKRGEKISGRIFNPVQYSVGTHVATFVMILVLYILSAAYVGSMSFNPFIYFRF